MAASGGRPLRVGPRPLSLHLRLAALEAALLGDVEAGRQQLAGFLHGVRAYRRHPYRPKRRAQAVLWHEGSCRLLDRGPAGGAPVLVLPSLVNRPRILELMAGRDLLGGLAAAGLRPLLLDWGKPGAVERSFRIEDYVGRCAAGALDAAQRLTGRRPALVGHCMGGLLALALAARRPEDVAGVALLATPWDFHADAGRLLSALALHLGPLSLTVGALGVAPVELLQGFFALLEPGAVTAKFRAFGAMAADDPRARLFVAVEDWVNDGVPLAGPVALEVLWHWYAANLPARGLWEVGGTPVRPERLDLPFFLAIPRRDRIVPGASAEALAARLPQAVVVRPSGGHIAMIVGSRAREELHAPLAAWLRRIAARRGRVAGSRGMATL